MSNSKLNSIVNQQIASSTEFWAGKPKLSVDQLAAIEEFAKKKGQALDDYFAEEANKITVKNAGKPAQE